jgi:hypothetical protein
MSPAKGEANCGIGFRPAPQMAKARAAPIKTVDHDNIPSLCAALI